jgi:hypothetical protein
MKKIIFFYIIYCDCNIKIPENINKFTSEKISNNKQITINSKKLFSIYLYEKFIKKDANFQNNQSAIKNEYVKQIFIWSLMPRITYEPTENFFLLNEKTEFKFDWDLINIFETIIDNISDDQVKNIIYNNKKEVNKLIIQFRDILKKLINSIMVLRIKVRTLEYLNKELKKKYSNVEILTNEDIQNKYMIESYILKVSMEIVNAYYEIHQIIIESNFVLDEDYINNIFDIFSYIYNNIHKKIKTKILNTNEIYNEIKNNSKNKIIIRKLKKNPNYSNFLKVSNFLTLSVNKNFLVSFSIMIGKFIQYFISLIFNRKVHKIELEYDNRKWEDLIKQKEIILEDNESNITFNKNQVIFLFSLLKNDNLSKTIKVKNTVHDYMNWIEAQESLIKFMLEKLLIENIIYKE